MPVLDHVTEGLCTDAVAGLPDGNVHAYVSPEVTAENTAGEFTLGVPGFTVKEASRALTVTVVEDADEVPHVLLATTDTCPELFPKVTVMEFVPCPAVIVAPPGTVHVYELAPGTGEML